jgi:hypothetical protein
MDSTERKDEVRQVVASEVKDVPSRLRKYLMRHHECCPWKGLS